MTLNEATQQLKSRLRDRYQQEAPPITELVMEAISGHHRLDRVLIGNQPLSISQQALFESYATQLEGGRPVQYVLGEAWFFRLRLRVDESVLIPRPETEELVAWALQDLDPLKKGLVAPTILDIGTGSGCIALAIKNNLPRARVLACDLSPEALQLARRNALELGLELEFFQTDILSAASREVLPAANIILSNPPYVPARDKASMDPHVLDHEPHLALFVPDNDALLFYREMAEFAATHLLAGGTLYLETHAELASEVLPLMQNRGFTEVELRKDLQGLDRMIRARRQ